MDRDKLTIIEWVLKQEKASALSPLLKLIQQTDEKVLDDNKLVGFRKPGRRITKKELIVSIRASLEELAANDLIALDELEQESDQW
jgi:hypothetical protein